MASAYEETVNYLFDKYRMDLSYDTVRACDIAFNSPNTPLSEWFVARLGLSFTLGDCLRLVRTLNKDALAEFEELVGLTLQFNRMGF